MRNPARVSASAAFRTILPLESSEDAKKPVTSFKISKVSFSSWHPYGTGKNKSPVEYTLYLDAIADNGKLFRFMITDPNYGDIPVNSLAAKDRKYLPPPEFVSSVVINSEFWNISWAVLHFQQDEDDDADEGEEEYTQAVLLEEVLNGPPPGAEGREQYYCRKNNKKTLVDSYFWKNYERTVAAVSSKAIPHLLQGVIPPCTDEDRAWKFAIPEGYKTVR